MNYEIYKQESSEWVNKVLRDQASILEGMAKIYLEQTGYNIEDIELVERRDSGTTTWYMRPKVV